ncbi:MAG: murein hydrolase activator EnvC family protein [Armatimonadota bacterium]
MIPSRHRRWFLAATLTALVGATPVHLAAAGPALLPAKQEELKRLQQQLDAQRQRLAQTRRRERRISDDVQGLDRQREVTERRLSRLSADLRRVRMRADVAAGALARAELALARRRSLLADRVLDAHRYGRAGYLDVVLGATSFAEFVARTRLVGAILHHDARLIQAYTTDRNQTAQLRVRLEEQQAQVRTLVGETEERRGVLTRHGVEKRDTLRRIVQERTASERAVRELEEDSTKLEALIQRLQGQGSLTGGRRLAAFILPLRGVMTSRFGFRVHPIFSRRHFHTGVDISARFHAPVRAASDGTVLFAGWYGGYGKLVVLDHGQGLSTLYGHLSTILVRPGQRITRNQVVGRVGSTGYSTGPHLHYEVRQNGRPVDPLR